MFLNTKSAEYAHYPYTVDEARGIYRFDCHGFVDQVLLNADPAVYREMGGGADPVLLTSYVAYFNGLDTRTPNDVGWTRVAHPEDLKPGDVYLWRPPLPGHVFIIAGEPKVNPEHNDEVLVRIIDSAPPDSIHSDDSRKGSDKGGLGSGILGLRVDGEGNPTGFNWKGGMNTASGTKDATILCGRLNR
jgi:hypothetical protein